MRRCFDLARQGIASVAPNPMVGAVIVHQDRIIGEGYHKQYGSAHAEVAAFNSVAAADKALLPDSTLYVNLEPCAHFGKTPPCADLIVRYRIPKVVICNIDPFSAVQGKGIAKLRAANIAVETGLLAAEGLWLNRRFFTFHTKQRPYIILKWAQTHNGYFAPTDSAQQWISNPLSKLAVHKWRSEAQAILVGTNTALIDNPRLNIRLWSYTQQPLRLVLDRTKRLPHNLHLFDGNQATTLFCSPESALVPSPSNASIIPIDFSASTLLPNILAHLYQQNIQSIIVEGGTQLLNAFIAQGLWDEARIFTAPISWTSGLVAPRLGTAKLKLTKTIGSNQLSVYCP